MWSSPAVFALCLLLTLFGAGAMMVCVNWSGCGRSEQGRIELECFVDREILCIYIQC